jgi:hypothetical protein
MLPLIVIFSRKDEDGDDELLKAEDEGKVESPGLHPPPYLVNFQHVHQVNIIPFLYLDERNEW